MPAPVYLRDTDGRFMLINRRYEEVHRVTRDDVELYPKVGDAMN